MPSPDLRFLPMLLLIGALAAPTEAAARRPQCPLPGAIQSSASKRAKLSVVATRTGASVTVCGTVTPRDAAKRATVVVRRGRQTLGRARQKLEAGRFAVEIKLARDPGAIRIVVDAGHLHLTRTLG